MLTKSVSVLVTSDFFSNFHDGILLEELDPYILDDEFYPSDYENFYFNARSSSSSLLLKHVNGKLFSLKTGSFQKISSKNREQQYLIDALLDENIRCVSVTGKAGTGKTLLVLAYAISQLHASKPKEIIITKSRVQVTDDDEEPMGEVPGDMIEKMAPQLLSYNTAFSKILGKNSTNYLQELIRTGRIQIIPLEFMRGVDFSDKIVICDEVQNCGRAQLKTLGTRINSSSRLILMGDLRQSDKEFDSEIPFSKLVDSDIYADSKITTHVHLIKQERGPLADLFDYAL